MQKELASLVCDFCSDHARVQTYTSLSFTGVAESVAGPSSGDCLKVREGQRLLKI